LPVALFLLCLVRRDLIENAIGASDPGPECSCASPTQQ